MTSTSEMTPDFIDQMVLAKMIHCHLWGKSYLAIPRLLRGLPQPSWKNIKVSIQKLQREGIVLTKVKKSERCISLNPRRANEIYHQIQQNEKVTHRVPTRFTRAA